MGDASNLNLPPHRPPREHPLWSAFELWCKDALSATTMRDVYWQAFLAGAQAGRRMQVDAEVAARKPEALLSKALIRAADKE